MVNVFWYGGASVQAQNWPINNASVSMQPFVTSDLRADPSGYGSVLERYFLGSTGQHAPVNLVMGLGLLDCLVAHYLHPKLFLERYQ